MLSEELEKLATLHREGALSDEEFEAAKAQLLKGKALPPAADRPTTDRPRKSDPLMGLNLDNYRALMHGSQLANYIFPGLGIAGPIILWAMAKDEYPEVDIEGKQIINWMISEVSFGLSCLMIGIPLFFTVIIAGIVLPLIGTIQASKGKSYRYPLTIELLT
jgi:uncharacterized protein